MYGWIIVTPKGNFLLSTFAQTDEECIDNFIVSNNIDTGETFQWWAQKRKEGYAVVSVVINRIVRKA